MSDKKCFDVWACKHCGRLVKVEYPTPYMPNTTCSCQFPEFVSEMTKLQFPRKETRTGVAEWLKAVDF